MRTPSRSAPFASCVFLAVLLHAAGTSAQVPPLPEPAGFVNDFAGVLTADEHAELVGITSDLERLTGVELAVAVVQSVAPRDSKSYAVDLFAKWGVGKKGRDNGVLILLAMQERRVEIEVGYGLEERITDAAAGRLLDTYAVPEFREGRFGAGLVALAGGIVRVVSGEEAEAARLAQEAAAARLEAYLAQEERARVEREAQIKWILMLTVGMPVIFMTALVTERPWMLLTATAGMALGGWLFWWLGAILGGLMGAFGGWFTPRRNWAGKGGGGGGSSSSGSSSSSSGRSSGSSGSSGGGSSGSSGFGGGRSGGGGAGRGF